MFQVGNKKKMAALSEILEPRFVERFLIEENNSYEDLVKVNRALASERRVESYLPVNIIVDYYIVLITGNTARELPTRRSDANTLLTFWSI